MIYGFEQPYLEGIKKELSSYFSNIYTDDFGSLIAENTDSEVLIGIPASENAFLINEITDDGLAIFSCLKDVSDDVLLHQTVSVNKKIGFICADNKIDFGYSDKKSVSKFLKAGDTVYIKPVIESCGNAYFTNSKCRLLKNIIVDIIKKSAVSANYAFLREDKKGAFALGKNLSMNTAYFLTLVPDLTEAACFIKKEGDFISDIYEKSPVAVLKTEYSLANPYYLSGGSSKSTGIGLRCYDLKNGWFKVNKDDIKSLINLLEASN